MPFFEKGTKPSIIITSSEVNIKKNEQGEFQTGGAFYVSKFGNRAAGMLTKMLGFELRAKGIRVNAINPDKVIMWPKRKPEEIPEGSNRTNAFIWLARENTECTGGQIDARDWINRDPTMFNKIY